MVYVINVQYAIHCVHDNSFGLNLFSFSTPTPSSIYGVSGFLMGVGGSRWFKILNFNDEWTHITYKYIIFMTPLLHIDENVPRPLRRPSCLPPNCNECSRFTTILYISIYPSCCIFFLFSFRYRRRGDVLHVLNVECYICAVLYVKNNFSVELRYTDDCVRFFLSHKTFQPGRSLTPPSRSDAHYIILVKYIWAEKQYHRHSTVRCLLLLSPCARVRVVVFNWFERQAQNGVT